MTDFNAINTVNYLAIGLVSLNLSRHCPALSEKFNNFFLFFQFSELLTRD